MSGTERSASFKLGIAKSLLEDVEKETEDIKKIIDSAIEEESMFSFLKAKFKVRLEINKLHKDLKLAIALAKEASEMEPDIQLDDGTTSSEIIALAHFRNGLIEYCYGYPRRAQKAFHESYQVKPMQEAVFYNSICSFSMMGSKGIIIRGIDNQKYYYSPIKRKKAINKIIEDLERMIDMDPASDLALEAGKIIAKRRK